LSSSTTQYILEANGGKSKDNT